VHTDGRRDEITIDCVLIDIVWHHFSAELAFLSRYAVASCLFVRPSVRPSFTRRYCVKTAKRIIKLFAPSSIHTILVFPYQTA